MIEIKWGLPQDAERAQRPLMHPQVSKWLGGVTYLDRIRDDAYTPRRGKIRFWYAEVEGKVVGTLLCGARPASFRAKYGSVGVLTDYRRRRLASALYAGMTMLELEGRRPSIPIGGGEPADRTRRGRLSAV